MRALPRILAAFAAAVALAVAPAAAQTSFPSMRLPSPAVSGDTTGTSFKVPLYWRTRAERTGYRETPDYEETMRYLRQLQGDSRWISIQSFGTSGQGRDLPLVVVSKDRAFTPEAARATGKPIVLIQNGIHSGEIEGKDACLALIRDLAVLRTREALLDHVVLLVVPMLSADAHERRSAFNRINQNGPAEMGWRTNPVGLNLNRDYVKAETIEIRALLSNVWTRWWPHLLVDDHTTDGADYRHDVTYAYPHGAGVPPSIDRWLAEAFEGRVVPRLAAMGHLPAPYVAFKGWSNDPAAGIEFGNPPPRFSNAYPVLHGRAAILVETHMFKPYGARVKGTYDLLVALLEELDQRPRDLVAAVAEAESTIVARGREPDAARREVVLRGKLSDKAESFAFKGWLTRWERSDITGGLVPRYADTPWDTVIALWREVVPATTVRQPVGYVVPQEWTRARDLLDVHGVHYRRFARAWTDSVEVQRIARWHRAEDGPYEGHWPIEVDSVALERRVRTARPGDLWVPLDQRSAPVAVHLFEAQAPDGLLYWNAFDTVLERKEYAEGYVMEPIARAMMAEDPALAREFRARLERDSAFAADRWARSEFFYRRSRWADPQQNLHPILRAIRRPPESLLAP
jgi:hypothetical protein